MTGIVVLISIIWVGLFLTLPIRMLAACVMGHSWAGVGKQALWMIALIIVAAMMAGRI